MRNEPLRLRRQLAQVLAATLRVIRRRPWMITLPGLVIAYVMRRERPEWWHDPRGADITR